MSDLHERLADLAEDAPVVPVSSAPGDLWRRGRRHRARRLVATGVGATVVAAVVALGATAGFERTQTLPEPAAPVGTTLVLPETVYGPPEWLGLLGRIGEGDRPGPLVALAGADVGGWTGTEYGYVAVTADQEYRVLDLPGSSGLFPKLSPDGRYVVYADADGLAAYDTVTGRVDGIECTRPAGWVWLDDTVIFRAAEGALAWTMGEDAAVAAPDPRNLGPVLDPRTLAPPVVVSVGPRELMVLRTPSDLVGAPVTTVDRRVSGSVVLSPDGTRVAAVVRAPGGGTELAVGELRPGTTTLTTVPGSAPVDGDLVGWRSDDSVVTTALSYGGELTAIDVGTGRQRTLVASTSPSGYSFQVAADALGAPRVPGVAPPSPPDPRWVAAGAAAAALVGLWVLGRWRRRRVR